MQERDVVAPACVVDVVGDEPEQLVVGGQAALDDVGATVAVGRGVGDPDDAEDALAAFYCAFDPATSPRVKAILVGAIAYFVMPFDILPDVLPLIGFGDDAAVLAAALAAVQGAVTKAHRDKARQTMADGL